MRDSIIFGWRCNQGFSETMDVLHTANMRYATVMSLNHHDQVQNSWRTCTGVGFRTAVFSQRLSCFHKSSQLSDWQSAHGHHEICFYHEFKSTRLKAQLLVDMLDVRTFQVYTIFVPILPSPRREPDKIHIRRCCAGMLGIMGSDTVQKIHHNPSH